MQQDFRIAQYKGSYPGELLLDLNRDRLSIFKRMAQMGDLVAFKPLSKNILLINHPDIVAEFASKYQYFGRGSTLKRFKFILGNGLITSDGEHHQRQRKRVAPAFTSKQLKRYSVGMIEHAEHWVKNFADGQSIDLLEEITLLTLDVITKALFGFDSNKEKHKISKALCYLIHYETTANRPIAKWLQALKVFPYIKKRRCTAQLNKVLYRLIDAKRSEVVDDESDMLSVLIAAKDDKGISGMTDQEVRDEIITLFMAGHETLANALTWSIYLLSQNNHVTKKLRDEINAVVGNEQISSEHVHQHQYAKQVFMESMRLYPPVWGMVRVALESTSLAGQTVDRGGIIIYSPYLAHHDDRYWDNAEVFEPERFSSSAEKRHKHCFIPFGVGIRHCIGEPFAMTEGILLLAIIMRHWDFEYTSKKAVDLELAITLRPNRMAPMKLHKADSA